MPALSFSVFRDKIESGEKRQTIRAVRKNPIKEGDKLFLFWKQQSPKDCEKLGEATCISVKPIKISYGAVYCNIPMASLEAFAIADGFDNWDDLVKYFEKNYGLPFEGVLIQWDAINATD
jgi:hypothetical protein